MSSKTNANRNTWFKLNILGEIEVTSKEEYQIELLMSFVKVKEKSIRLKGSFWINLFTQEEKNNAFKFVAPQMMKEGDVEKKFIEDMLKKEYFGHCECEVRIIDVWGMEINDVTPTITINQPVKEVLKGG